MGTTTLFRGGQLIDGTGSAAQDVDVAVRDGKVSAIGPRGTLPPEGDVLDIPGLILCPAFIDTHSHSDLAVLEEPDLQMKVRQGIALDVLGQDGVSVAPLSRLKRPMMERTLSGLDGKCGTWDWETVSEYLGRIERTPRSIHAAYLVPHGNIRLEVVGPDDRLASAAEVAGMCDELERGLDAGAVGLSTGLIYPPCCYGDTAELISLGRILTRHDRPIVVHMRSESDALKAGVEEMLKVGRESGCRVHISHLKIAGRDNWGLLDWLLGAFAQAARDGVRLTADQYPYTAGSTMMGAILPPWAHSGGFERTLHHLADPEARRRMRDDILGPGPNTWDNFWSWGGPEGIFISSVESGAPGLEGLSLADASRTIGQDPLEFALDLLLRERMGVGMIAFSQSEDVIRTLMQQPNVNVCTDGLLGGNPHPRAYGTFPRVLGRYVRQQGALVLPEAVRKMTSQAADALTLRGRGRVVVGAPADLVVFDPATVLDTATYAQPRQYPTGMPHVMVGGRLVVKDGVGMGERPGEVVRG